MASSVKVTVKLDKRALDKELTHRDGAVGKVIAGFGGEVTKEIKSVFVERAGGAFWPVHTRIAQSGRQGTTAFITIRRTRAHRITAINTTNLVFFWEREGRMFRGPSVNHPGSSPPLELVLSGIERASRRITFLRGAPATSRF